jgi:hypothetical protein
MAEVKAWFAAQSKQTQYKIIALGLTLVVVFSLVLSDQGSASTENAISPVTTAEPAIAKTLLVHVVGEVRRPGIFE